MNAQMTTTIAARNLHAGHRLFDPRLAQGLTVRRVLTCADGSLRIFTDHDEQRMTGSVTVRVLN